MSRLYCVYKTVNLQNGKVYFGKSSVDRVEKGYVGSGQRLKEAIQKYGKEKFQTTILETFSSSEEAYRRERELVSQAVVGDSNTYNLKVGGEGGTSGTVWMYKEGHEIHIDICLEQTMEAKGYVRGRCAKQGWHGEESRKKAIEHSHRTLRERYGGITKHMVTPECRRKSLETFRKNHGGLDQVEFLHSDTILQKSIQTRISRYGSVAAPMNTPEAMKKKSQTFIRRYGAVMGQTQTPEVRAKNSKTRKKNNELRRQLVKLPEYMEWWDKQQPGKYRGPYYAVGSFLLEKNKKLEEFFS